MKHIYQKVGMTLLRSSLFWGLFVQLEAATITVDTNSGGGVGTNGCTLVEAIMSANQDIPIGGCVAGSEEDIIKFEFDQFAPITLSNEIVSNEGYGLPKIESDITIECKPNIIETDLLTDMGIFFITATGKLILNNIILQNARGAECGGAIHNEGKLTLNNSTLKNNIVKSGDWALGGAICNWNGEVSIVGSTIINNSTDDSYLGINQGGGIYNHVESNLTIINSMIQFNTAKGGGGISSAGNLTLIDSTISTNIGAYYGGGLFVYTAGEATIIRSTFTENEIQTNEDHALGGGAIYNVDGTIRIETSTFSRNKTLTPSQGKPGAAIYNDSGAISLKNVTISDNYANADGVGIYNNNILTMTNTIVANSFSVEPDGEPVLIKNDVDGIAPVINISNIIENDDAASWVASCTDCITNIDPMLNVLLSDNGGPTQTRALLRGSVAINTGDLAECPVFTFNPLVRVDQRYIPRDEQCDIGAYEYQEPTGNSVLPAVIMYLLN